VCIAPQGVALALARVTAFAGDEFKGPGGSSVTVCTLCLDFSRTFLRRLAVCVLWLDG
jgi:hypothetical protein